MLDIYLARQTIQFNHFNRLFTGHDRKWAGIFFGGGNNFERWEINLGRNFVIRKKRCGSWDSTSWEPLVWTIQRADYLSLPWGDFCYFPRQWPQCVITSLAPTKKLKVAFKKGRGLYLAAPLQAVTTDSKSQACYLWNLINTPLFQWERFTGWTQDDECTVLLTPWKTLLSVSFSKKVVFLLGTPDLKSCSY